MLGAATEPGCAGAAEMPLERLEAEICELAGHLAAGECRWLLLLSEFDRREGWAGFGLQSCAHWLSYRCGVGLQAAREKLRVARRLGELPLVTEAFAAGELSYSKVRAVCRVARPETEPALVEMARYATASQLEEITRTYRSVTGRPELEGANDRHDGRFARWHWDDDGSLVLQARLTPEDGAVVLAALQAGREVAEESQARSDSAESPLGEVRNADALVAMATLAVSAPAGAERRAPEVVIVDRAVIGGAAEDGRCHLDGGPAIPPETARRLAAMPPSSPSRRRPTARRSTWGASGGRHPRRCGGRCGVGTGGAGSRAAAPGGSSTPITSGTGPRAARRSSPT